MQLSYMLYYENAHASLPSTVLSQFFIQSASYTGSQSDETPNHYDSWSIPQQFSTAGSGTSLLAGINSLATGSTGRTIETTSGNTFSSYQGYYVRIYMLINATQGNGASVLKLKGLVWRTSRAVGGSTTPGPAPILPG